MTNKTKRPVEPSHESIAAATAWCRQSIETHYCGPTDTKGGRIVAKAEAGRIVVSWDHAIGVAENHARAALMLASKFGWTDYNRFVGGGTKRGYVFVAVPLKAEV